MIKRELQAVLSVAVNEAIRRRHEYVTLEHLLFALLHDKTASEIVRHCGGQVDALRSELANFLKSEIESFPLSGEHLPEQTGRSEEHTSELQSHLNLVCRLLLEKKK